MGSPCVLVVEDEPVINEAVADRLRAEGFSVEQAYDGPGAVERYAATRPDLVVLDVMLPGFDGLEVCRRIQAQAPVPVLMLTARDDEADILVGLAVGADDYLTKPFRMRELVARVRALLRRVERAAELAARPAARLVVGDLVVDTGARRVVAAGEEVHLTPTEFDLLARLAIAPGDVLTRERLLADVWDWAEASGTRTVDSHVKALRAKIGADRVRTVHGVGYALEGPAR
jgi:DNA-binding response OmpR family regulator